MLDRRHDAWLFVSPVNHALVSSVFKNTLERISRRRDVPADAEHAGDHRVICSVAGAPGN
jgi:NAD(P)H-dependent FMN reductase